MAKAQKRRKVRWAEDTKGTPTKRPVKDVGRDTSDSDLPFYTSSIRNQCSLEFVASLLKPDETKMIWLP